MKELCQILLIVLFVASIRHAYGISQQLRAFQRAIDDARMQLEGCRPNYGTEDEELMRQRRQAINELLATFKHNDDQAEQTEINESKFQISRIARAAGSDELDDTATKEDLEEAKRLADERTRILLDEAVKDSDLSQTIDLSQDLNEVAKLNMKYKGVDSAPVCLGNKETVDIMKLMSNEPVLDALKVYDEIPVAVSEKRQTSNVDDSELKQASNMENPGNLKLEEADAFQNRMDSMEVGKIKDLIKSSEADAVSNEASKESKADSNSLDSLTTSNLKDSTSNLADSNSLDSLSSSNLKDSTSNLAEESSGEQHNSPLPSSSLRNNEQDPDANDYSHEANYKLSKIEQDASEHKKSTDHGSLGKRSAFNPMSEIKLRTSTKLMNKGFGPSLPSYSLIDSVEYTRDSLIDNALKRVEQRIQKGHQNDDLDRIDELLSYEDAKRGSFFDTPHFMDSPDMKFHEIKVDDALLKAGSMETNFNAENVKRFDSSFDENLLPRTKRLDGSDEETSSGVLANAEELLRETQESAKKIKRLMQKNQELKASTRALHDEVNKISNIVDMNDQTMAKSKLTDERNEESLEIDKNDQRMENSQLANEGNEKGLEVDMNDEMDEHSEESLEAHMNDERMEKSKLADDNKDASLEVDMNDQRMAKSKRANGYKDARVEEEAEAYKGAYENANEVRPIYGSNEANAVFENNDERAAYKADLAKAAYDEAGEARAAYESDEAKAAYEAAEGRAAYEADIARAAYESDEARAFYESDLTKSAYKADEANAGYETDEAIAGYDTAEARAAYEANEARAAYEADEARANEGVGAAVFDNIEYDENKPRTRVKRIGFLDPKNAGKLLSVAEIDEGALGSFKSLTMDRKKRASESGQNLWVSNDFDTIEMNEDDELHNRLKRQKLEELGYPYFNDRLRRSLTRAAENKVEEGKALTKEPVKMANQSRTKAKREEQPKDIAQAIEEQLKNNSAPAHHRVKRFRRKRARAARLPANLSAESNSTEVPNNKAKDKNEPSKEHMQVGNATSNSEHSNANKTLSLKKDTEKLEAQVLGAEHAKTTTSNLRPATVRTTRKRRRTRRSVSVESSTQPPSAMSSSTSLNTGNTTFYATNNTGHKRNKRSAGTVEELNSMTNVDHKIDNEIDKPYDFDAVDKDIEDLREREKKKALQLFDFNSAASEFGNQEFDNIKQSVPKESSFKGMNFDNLKNNRYFKHFDQKSEERSSKMNSGKTSKRYNPDCGEVTLDCKIKEKAPPKANTKLPGKYHGKGQPKCQTKNKGKHKPQSHKINTSNQSGHAPSEEDRALVIALRDELLNCTAFSRLEGLLRAMSPKLSEIVNKSLPLLKEPAPVTQPDDFGTSNDKNQMDEPQEQKSPFTGDKGLESDSQAETLDQPEASRTTENESYKDKNQESAQVKDQNKDQEKYKEQNKNTVKVFGENSKNANDTLKMNITINASVLGREQANNFFGNGTIRVLNGVNSQEYRVPRSTLDYEPAMKRKCGSNRGKAKCRPTPSSSINTDKLSAQVVHSMFGMVRNNPEFKVLWPSLKHNQEQLKNSAKHCKTNFAAVRCKENEGQIERTEQLLKKAMDTINDLIEEQVRTRTCTPLRPDLREFYELILQTHAQNQKAREKRENKFVVGNDFSKLVRELDPSKIDERSRIVKKLLCQYDELPREDQQEVASIREDLLKNLVYLRQLKEGQESIQRRKRAEEISESMRPNSASDAPLVQKLEAEFTPAYLKLLKTSELFREAASEAEQYSDA